MPFRTPFIQDILGQPWRHLIRTAKMLAVAHLVWEYGFSIGPAVGPSMLPTFEVMNELVLVSKLHRNGRGVKVGDLVVYKIPIFPDSDGIKRVIGMPGDYVMIDTPGSESESMIQVPPGHCWVVGDNLPASRDSRIFGPVPMALVRGKVIAKLWPLWKSQFIKNPLQPPQE